MQQTQILGRLGKDAEVKDVGDTQVINFSVAVSENWKDKNGEKQEKTTWYECAKWGNNVGIAPYLKKGTQVYVSGNAEARAYVNNDGDAVGVLGIRVFQIELLGSKDSQSEPNTQQQPQNNNSSTADDPFPF